MRFGIVFAALMGVLSATGVAAAQDQAPTAGTTSDKMQSWTFPDDKLLDVKGGAGGMTVMTGPKVVRTILTRPRTQFIPELLKTIEGL